METPTTREIIHLLTYIASIVGATIAVNAYFLSPVTALQERVAIIEHEHVLYRDDVLQQLTAIVKRQDKEEELLNKILLK